METVALHFFFTNFQQTPIHKTYIHVKKLKSNYG